jgi:hypothetical protein
LFLIPKTSQVNNALDALFARGVGEILGGLPVFLFELSLQPLPVQEKRDPGNPPESLP